MQFLQPSDLASAYYDAQQVARKSWLKYDELERLANNEVRSDLPANMPKVNDGSLSATVKKIPKRLFAKPMTGAIKALDRDEDWVAELTNIILEKRIIPNANTDASFLRKWKIAVRNSKVYGSQPIYTFFTQHGSYTGADMSLPYVRNVYLEPGAISDMASDYIFMDSWFTKLKARRLLDKAIADQAAVDAGELEPGDVMWDPKALQAWYDAGPSGKDSQNQTAQERTGINRNEKGLYKLTSCFNRGAEAPFYTFAPSIGSKVVGTQQNTNPTGDVPIIYLYDDEDLIDPYGTGLVQAAGANQNVLDNLTQTDVLATQIGAQPPIDIHGDRSQTNLRSLVYAPSQFWFSGNATVTPVTHANPQFYNALPGRFGLYKSQQQFITGTFDNSVSAESGAPGFSKTDAGVNALQNQTNADDNDTQQSIADAYTRVIKSLVNIHMNNMEGSEMLKLEGDEIDRMAKTDLVPTDPNTGEAMTQEIELVWDNLRGSFEFEVDPDSSILKDDKGDSDALQQMIGEAASNPMIQQLLQQSGWKLDIGEAYAEAFGKMGIKNIDKILVKISPEEQAEMEQQQAMQQGAIDPATGQPIPQDPNAPQQALPQDDPSLANQSVLEAQGMDPEQEQLPTATHADPLPEQDIQARIQQIQEQYNVDEDTALTIASAEDHGATEDEIPHILNYMNQGAAQ